MFVDFSDKEKWGNVDVDSIESSIKAYNECRFKYLEWREEDESDILEFRANRILNFMTDIRYEGNGKIYSDLLSTPCYSRSIEKLGISTNNIDIIPRYLGKYYNDDQDI